VHLFERADTEEEGDDDGGRGRPKRAVCVWSSAKAIALGIWKGDPILLFSLKAAPGLYPFEAALHSLTLPHAHCTLRSSEPPVVVVVVMCTPHL
jgi:hypothetical protein